MEHSDNGSLFEGKVTARIFRYDPPAGDNVDGAVGVTLCLDRTAVQ